MNDRFGERHGKVGIVGTRPSVRDTIACNQRIVFDADIRPKDFSVVIVDTMNHIQNDSLVLRFFRERIFMNPPAWLPSVVLSRRSRPASLHSSRDGIPPYRARNANGSRHPVGCRSGIQFQFAGSRHNQDIAEVGMSGSAEMRMAEPDDTAVLMLIAGTIFIGTRLILAIHVMRDRVRVRAQLTSPKGTQAPGNVCPIPFVPIIGFTNAALSWADKFPKISKAENKKELSSS